MKLIHCSDIHLDSRMETNLSRHQAARRSAELLETFVNLTDYAAEQGVTAVMICGDLFDTSRTSSTTVGRVLDAIARYPDIDFLYLRGNHDESGLAFASRELPENLKLFSQSWQYHRYGNVVIAGAELSPENCASLYADLKLDGADVNIVMLHGQESTRPDADSVCIPALRGRQIRYLALGHLHSYSMQPLDTFGQYCYCGCLEGRGFDECGEKGFALVEIRGNRLRTEFVPFARRQLHEIQVDITGLTQTNRIYAAMLDAAADIPRKDLVKFVLRGSFSPECSKDLTYLHNALGGKFYSVKIADESTLALEPASYENDISLKGEFTRLVMGASLPNEDRECVLLAGLQALRGEEITL